MAEACWATGASHTLTDAEEEQTIQVRVDFTDDAGNDETLNSIASDPVAARPTPLTASFGNMPAAHDGSAFTFDLNFSENVKAGYARIRTRVHHQRHQHHRHRRPEDQGQQPELDHHGPARRQRRHNDHAARDHQLQRRRRHLHPGRQEVVELHLDPGRRTGIGTGAQRTPTSSRATP